MTNFYGDLRVKLTAVQHPYYAQFRQSVAAFHLGSGWPCKAGRGYDPTKMLEQVRPVDYAHEIRKCCILRSSPRDSSFMTPLAPRFTTSAIQIEPIRKPLVELWASRSSHSGSYSSYWLLQLDKIIRWSIRYRCLPLESHLHVHQWKWHHLAGDAGYRWGCTS